MLFRSRVTVLAFSALVLGYAIAMQGTSIYELVSGAYQVTLVGAFVPLVCGLYWPRATTQGAVLSVALGFGIWMAFVLTPLGEVFPAQLSGLIGAIVGMVGGTLAPQCIKHAPAHVCTFEESPAHGTMHSSVAEGKREGQQVEAA